MTTTALQPTSLQDSDSVIVKIRKALVTTEHCKNGKGADNQKLNLYMGCYSGELPKELVDDNYKQYYDTKYQLKPMGYVVGISLLGLVGYGIYKVSTR